MVQTIISPASRQRVRISQVPEVTRGTIPTNPAWLAVPTLDNSYFNQMQNYTRSAEVISSRQGGKYIGGSIDPKGALDVPVKYDAAIRDIFSSALSASLIHPTKAGVTLAFVTDGITSSANDLVSLGFKAGATITTTGATTSGNNKTATIVSVVAGKITVAAATYSAEAFPVGGSVTSADYYAKSGTGRVFFSHEVAFLDLLTPVYEYYSGSEVNTMDLKIPTSGEVSGSVAFVGTTVASGTTQAPIGSGAYTAASTVAPFGGATAGSSLLIGGVATAALESLDVKLNNNRASKFAVGQQLPAFIEEGTFDADLTFGMYFSDLSNTNLYTAGTRTSLEVTTVDQESGHKMILSFPNIVFTNDQRGTSGQTVIENMTASAEADSVSGSKVLCWFRP